MQNIIVSAQIGGIETRPKLRYFERLDEALQQRGISITLLNLSGEKPETNLAVLDIPKFVHSAHRIPLFWRWFSDRGMGNDDYACDLDAQIFKASKKRSSMKMMLYRCFLSEVFVKYKPGLCILWNSFTPFHRIFSEYCSNMSIPVVFAEYGVLPGTLVFERGGQMAESWVAMESQRFRSLPLGDDDLTEADEALNWMRTSYQSRKPQNNDIDLTPLFQRLKMQNKKIIFYAGQNDLHSGISPRSAPQSKIHSPHYNDTLDALEHLAVLAGSNNWHVVFKPHPLIKSSLNLTKIQSIKNITTVPDANIFTCMEQSDVTVTILSQVSYMALIHEKPCVLLGRNQLSDKKCLYEIQDKKDCEKVINQSLEKGFTDNQKLFFRMHVGQLLKYYLYKNEIENMNWGQNLLKAAEFLAEKLLQSEKHQRIFNFNNISAFRTHIKFSIRKLYDIFAKAETFLKPISKKLAI